MTKKYYVISDIHGHYDEMIRDLYSRGYDESDNEHHLIVLGDMFDRGTQSKEVLEYLFNLYKNNSASIILGNHDSFLIEFLNGLFYKAEFNMRHNGTKKTLESLVGRSLTYDENWEEIRAEINGKYDFLNDFLHGLPLYLEIGDYIFVHGGIKYNNGDWMNNCQNDFIWSYEIELERVPDKIVVAGHHRVATIRYPRSKYEELFIEHPEAFNILYEEGKILIDAFVEISKKINVLLLEL